MPKPNATAGPIPGGQRDEPLKPYDLRRLSPLVSLDGLSDHREGRTRSGQPTRKQIDSARGRVNQGGSRGSACEISQRRGPTGVPECDVRLVLRIRHGVIDAFSDRKVLFLQQPPQADLRESPD